MGSKRLVPLQGSEALGSSDDPNSTNSQQKLVNIDLFEMKFVHSQNGQRTVDTHLSFAFHALASVRRYGLDLRICQDALNSVLDTKTGLFMPTKGHHR